MSFKHAKHNIKKNEINPVCTGPFPTCVGHDGQVLLGQILQKLQQLCTPLVQIFHGLLGWTPVKLNFDRVPQQDHGAISFFQIGFMSNWFIFIPLPLPKTPQKPASFRAAKVSSPAGTRLKSTCSKLARCSSTVRR